MLYIVIIIKKKKLKKNTQVYKNSENNFFIKI